MHPLQYDSVYGVVRRTQGGGLDFWSIPEFLMTRNRDQMTSSEYTTILDVLLLITRILRGRTTTRVRLRFYNIESPPPDGRPEHTQRRTRDRVEKTKAKHLHRAAISLLVCSYVCVHPPFR
jgi:hypothetical protein